MSSPFDPGGIVSGGVIITPGGSGTSGGEDNIGPSITPERSGGSTRRIVERELTFLQKLQRRLGEDYQ